MNDEPTSRDDATPDGAAPRATPPGLIHSYQAYDPKNFPSPTAPAPDLASAAMEHMLAHGSMRELTPEELARAIKIDPSMFPRLGPSIDALRGMLEDRKRKILSTYETDTVQNSASDLFHDSARTVKPEKRHAPDFYQAVKEEQIADLERLWYAQRDEQGEFAKGLMRVMAALGDKYQVDELASKYTFTGRTPLTVPEALAIKEELEAIDKLLEQLEEAAKNAQVGIIDLEELAKFAESAQIEELNRLQQQVEDYLRQEAERQGLEATNSGYALTPKAYKLFQSKLLSEIFSQLEAARSGRHTGPVVGEGAVETQRTKPYEFGDSAAHMDVVQSVLNAIAREGTQRSRSSRSSDSDARSHRPTPDASDLEIHRTRNNPRCATAVLLDMSGSMRHGGQYIHVKRMGLALDALIRSEYPGDFLRFVEMSTFAKVVPARDLAALMPKPVSIHSSVVRLKADMGDPNMSEWRIPQHFTNIQRSLQIARQMLAVQDTPNRQVVLITDGLPTAHFDGRLLYMLYPPDPLTEEATMREAHACARENITINIFLLPSWSQTHEDIQFAQRVAESTRGRVFFTGGGDLDRYVLWDYVSNRRKIIG